jgi:hypothetical protein
MTYRGRMFLGALFAVAASLVLMSPALAQSADQLQLLSKDPKYRQLQYFYNQRAYPNATIPPGAFAAARQEFIQKFGTEPGTLSNAPTATSWTSLGPSPIGTSPTVSGRTNAIAVNPSNANVIYIGTADGGVWETTNGGTSWTALTDSQCSLAMGGLAIDPVNNNIVYAATGEQNFSQDSYYGCGVLRSADGGQTWTQLGASVFAVTGSSATMSRISVDPTTAGSTTTTTVVVAADTGVWRSTNSGSTWTSVLSGAAATDLVRDPSTPATLYAALGNIFGSANNGVYKSTDGGVTWNQIFAPSFAGRINIGIAPSSPSTLYAAVQSSSTFALLGIFKSTDSGSTWNQLTATNATCTFFGSAQCWYDLYVFVDPTNANTVYFGSQDVFKSTDGGSTFADIGGYSGGIHPDQHFLAFDPTTHTTIYAANDGGIFKSTDGGTSWTSLNANLTTTQFGAGLSTTPAGTSVLGGTQDNGTNLYTGSTVWAQVFGGDGGFTDIDFSTPTTFYTENFDVSPQRSTDSGSTWTSISAGVNESASSLFYTPFVMSPSNSHTLYLGTDILNRTTNQGSTWTALTSTLLGNISAIAEAKSNSQVIYYGTDSGHLEVSTNGGTSFTSINTGLPNRYVSYIAIDPTHANNVFATFSGFGTGGHVFASTNSGASWTNISGNLPNIPVNAILLNPSSPTTNIFIGTDLGVMATTNGGTSWSPFLSGLPNVAVVDLVYNGTAARMFAATHGRGVWSAPITACSAPGDFNGDCNSDLVFQNSTLGGALWLWEMSGNQIVANGSLPLPTPSSGWQVVGTGDFNGDGHPDLVFQNQSTGALWLWEMSGTTIIANGSLPLPTPSSGWKVVAIGDFNRDGHPDLVFQNNSTGALWLWEMSGTTITNSVPLPTPSSGWKVVGAGNFDGDGFSDDLVFQNNSTNALWLWEMNGTTIAGSVPLPTPNTGWAVVGVGDINGDGKSDLVFQNSGLGGALWLWEMNGTAISSSLPLPTPSSGWSVRAM